MVWDGIAETRTYSRFCPTLSILVWICFSPSPSPFPALVASWDECQFPLLFVVVVVVVVVVVKVGHWPSDCSFLYFSYWTIVTLQNKCKESKTKKIHINLQKNILFEEIGNCLVINFSTKVTLKLIFVFSLISLISLSVQCKVRLTYETNYDYKARSEKKIQQKRDE